MKGKLRLIEGECLMFWCPGCESPHTIHYGPGGWTWNGDADRPTFHPSLLSRGRDLDPNDETKIVDVICHMWVKDGIIQFLSDSNHKLAGQNVPVPEPPDWLKD